MFVPFFLSSSGFWYDSRLRCDTADLYFKLYGKKSPVCIPLPEFAAMMKKPVVSKPEKIKSDVNTSFILVW